MKARHPSTPDLPADELLAVGLNMAEAAWPLLCAGTFLCRLPDDHPFKVKLRQAYDWLEEEGFRILIDIPADTVAGVAIKARAMTLHDGTYESGLESDLLASLTADLDRLAATPEPPKLKVAA